MATIQQGWGSMTAATQNTIRKAIGGAVRSGVRKVKRKVKSTAKRVTKRAAKRSGKAARLVKGSAAAKRYMAKIRKLRK